jgi:hypothetical protein
MHHVAVITLPPGLECCLSRQPPHTYRVMFARAYGMATWRQHAVLNPSTPANAPQALSPRERPLVWIEDDHDICFGRSIVTALAGEDGQLPFVARTGRTRKLRRKECREIELVEVEILLDEDQLSRGCRHCETTELYRGEQSIERVGEDGYESVYCCSQVSSSSRIREFSLESAHPGAVLNEILLIPSQPTGLLSYIFLTPLSAVVPRIAEGY